MPRFRKRMTRRKFRPRRNRRRFKRRRGGLVRKVNIALARSKPERKFKDYSAVTTTVDIVGTIIDPMTSGIAAGTGDDQRIGNRLFMRNYDLRFSLNYNNDATLAQQVIRLIWFTYSSTQTPGISSVLEQDSIYSHYSKANASLFKIISDRFYHVGDQGTATLDIFQRKLIKVNVKFIYESVGDSIPLKNRLWYLIVGSDSSVNQPVITLVTRVNYYDN